MAEGIAPVLQVLTELQNRMRTLAEAQGINAPRSGLQLFPSDTAYSGISTPTQATITMNICILPEILTSRSTFLSHKMKEPADSPFYSPIKLTFHRKATAAELAEKLHAKRTFLASQEYDWFRLDGQSKAFVKLIVAEKTPLALKQCPNVNRSKFYLMPSEGTFALDHAVRENEHDQRQHHNEIRDVHEEPIQVNSSSDEAEEELDARVRMTVGVQELHNTLNTASIATEGTSAVCDAPTNTHDEQANMSRSIATAAVISTPTANTNTPATATLRSNNRLRRRRICQDCGSTYMTDCLHCIQRHEFQRSLENDSNRRAHTSDGEQHHGLVLGATHGNTQSDTSVGEQHHRIVVDGTPMNTETVREVLERLKHTVGEERILVNVTRANVFDGMLSAYETGKFESPKQIDVVFHMACHTTKDDDVEKVVAEGAVDTGGPTRELFQLFMNSCSQSNDMHLFDGPSHARFLAMNTEAMEDGMYEATGFFFGLSLLLGGPSPSFLAPGFADVILGRTPNLSVGDIPDDQLRATVQKVEDAETPGEAMTHLLEEEVLVKLAGVPSVINSQSVQEKIVKQLTRFIILDRNRGCYDQFLQGMARTGLLTELRCRQGLFEPMFVHHGVTATADSIKKLAVFEHSESGSDREVKEMQVRAWFADFLRDCEDRRVETTLAMLMAFATGLEAEPPLGFNPPLTIAFIHERDAQLPAGSKLLARGNTCGNTLLLPVTSIHRRYKHFKCDMDLSISWSSGFANEMALDVHHDDDLPDL